MFSYIWPIALVVLSNIVYHICAKSVPDTINPFASLTVTYLIGAVVSAIAYFALSGGGNLIKEYSNVNWAMVVLGIVIVGLEAGFIYAYKAGWEVSIASVVQSCFLAVALLIVGKLLYHEPISANKLAGMLISLFGLYLINKK